MMIFFVISAILILIYFLAVAPYVTIDIDWTADKLSVWVCAWFIKKKFEIDFSEKPEEKEKAPKENISDKDCESANTKDTKETDSAEENSFSIKDKLTDIKSRIFNEEKGFDTDEAKAVAAEAKSKFVFVWSLLGRFFSAMRYKIKIPVWRITLDFGTDNAAATGMLYGSVWGAIGTLYPLLARYAYVVYPFVDITPDFYGKRFDIRMKSIIKVRPMHIINAAVPPLLTYLKEYLKTTSRQDKNDKK